MIGVKKVEKLGIVFKLLYEWLMLYYEKKAILDEYYVRCSYVAKHLRSELSNFSEGEGKGEIKEGDGNKEDGYGKGDAIIEVKREEKIEQELHTKFTRI